MKEAGEKIQRERKREVRKQINNKAVDFITLLIFSTLSSSPPVFSCVMLNNTEKKSLRRSGGGGRDRRGRAEGREF